MSDTPRTDAADKNLNLRHQFVEFARKLERENVELVTVLRELVEDAEKAVSPSSRMFNYKRARAVLDEVRLQSILSATRNHQSQPLTTLEEE